MKEGSRGTFESHSEQSVAMAFSPHGQLLVSASSDTTVEL